MEIRSTFYGYPKDTARSARSATSGWHDWIQSGGCHITTMMLRGWRCARIVESAGEWRCLTGLLRVVHMTVWLAALCVGWLHVVTTTWALYHNINITLEPVSRAERMGHIKRDKTESIAALAD